MTEKRNQTCNHTSTEREFQRAWAAFLKKEKCMPFSIETAATGQGVPDMYVLDNAIGMDWWCELKRVKKSMATFKLKDVKFRPGQKAWQLIYNRVHTFCKVVFTLVAYDDGFVLLYVLQGRVNVCFCNDMSDVLHMVRGRLKYAEDLDVYWKEYMEDENGGVQA